MTEAKYECVHEQLLQNHSLKLKELETEIDFKKEKIDTILDDQKKMDKKIDTLIDTVNTIQMKSIMGDSDINQRVSSIESELSTVRWMLGLSVTVLGVAIAALAFLVTHIH